MQSEAGKTMLKLKSLIVAGLMLAAASAVAQEAPSGLSAEGRQQLEANQKQKNEALAPLLEKRRELKKQYEALMTPAAFDSARLEATMSEMRALEGRIVETQQASLLALLTNFSEEDRKSFFETVRKAPAPAPRAPVVLKEGEGR